jgi:three-Cys-motif partner protein
MSEPPILPGMESFVAAKPATDKPKKNKSQYLWIPGDDPPELGEHSLAKHRILRQYLETYVAILTSNRAVEKLNLSLVDGFSGGGAYRCPLTGEKIAGSPVLMLEAMASAEAKANEGKKKPFTLEADFYFIERQKPTIEYLKREIGNCEAAIGKDSHINILPGRFAKHLDAVIKQIKTKGRRHRAIFLLDQYGYTDVTLSNMRKIFRELPFAEVILTFAVDWLADFVNESEKFDSALRNLELSHKRDLLVQIRENHAADWRPTIQHLLHQHFYEKSGADCYTPFFINSTDSHRAYWLLHFSKHSTARNAMVDLHWRMQNHFQHFGKAGFEMLLGFDPSRMNDTPMLPFDFGHDAAVLTRESLLIELPERLSRFGETVSFRHFFQNIVNETPATKKMIALAASQLTKDREIEVLTTGRKLRRNGVIIHDDDLLRLPATKSLFLPRTFDD